MSSAGRWGAIKLCRIRLLWLALLPAALGLAAAAPEPREPRLVRTTLTIAPSTAQLETVPAFSATWWLGPALARDLGPVLVAASFSPDLAERLHGAIRLQPDGSGLITPEAAWLDAFTPAERQRWHLLLALHPGNHSYRWPLAIRTEVLDRLDTIPALGEATGRVRRWGSLGAERVRFSDLFALEDAFATPGDRTAFFREVLAADTTFLKLDVSETGAEVAHWAAYWQVHGRYKAIEPFYSATLRVRDHDRIDLAHILPQFARGLLHTFPPDFAVAADLAVESGLLAAGFFNPTPEEPAALDDGFSAWLRRECVPVAEPPQFGDVLVFEDPNRTPWPYVAVYIADGLVLARRPTLFGAWSFLEISAIARHNPRLGGQPPTVHRRRASWSGPAEAPFRRGPLPGSWNEPAALRTGNAGPWGRLVTYDVLLAPSGDQLERMPEPNPTPEWTLLIEDREALLEELAAMAMPDALRSELNRWLTTVRGRPGRPITLRPSLTLALGLPPPVRARLFRHLVTGGDSYAQTLRIATTLPPDQWFPEAVLPEPARSAVLGLVYPLGRGFALSDYGALFSVLPTEREDRLTALRAVFRTPAVVALLEKPAMEDIPGIIAYWRLDQQKSVAALLTSFAESDQARTLDIVHLLTPLARELLNLYTVADANAPAASCYWTALNFAAAQPDPRLLVLPTEYGTQSTLAWEKLQLEYFPVEGPGQFGDIVAYRERGGRRDLLHVCAFIADELVFTKNGIGLMAPWCLMRLENVDALYLDDAHVERLTFRRQP